MKKINGQLDKLGVDKITLSISLFSVLFIATFITYDTQFAQKIIDQSYQSIVSVFGPSYLILTLFCFFFLIFLCISRFGDYRLGGNDAETEFNYLSWIGMLFCSGIGGGIIYWSGVEWSYYVGNPPFNIEPYSQQSFSLATAYGLFHWGISAWSIYGIPAIALSIAFYKYKLNSLRLSSSLSGLGISNIETTIFGRFIDLIFILATVGAAGGTIGSYIPMLSSGFTEIFNLNNGLYLDILVICLCVSLFGYSVYKGLDKGIRNLSNFNLMLALLFLLIIVFSTNFLGLLETSFSGLVFSVVNFWDMSTLGINEESKFAEEWTIFYWAWWVAFGPLVGLFIARISKGRTIRQVVLGMLFFGTLGTWLFYMILGGFAMNLELSGEFSVLQSMNSVGHADTAIAVVKNLPFEILMVFIFCLITIIFVTTSYDSMSYVISYHVMKTSNTNKEPGKKLRLFWAIILGILPAALVLYSDHSVALDIILITSLPLMLIYPLMAISIYRELIQ